MHPLRQDLRRSNGHRQEQQTEEKPNEVNSDCGDVELWYELVKEF